MAIKQYNAMSLKEAMEFSESSPDLYKSLYKRYTDTIRRRIKVFEKHDYTSRSGYDRLRQALLYSKTNSPEAFSYMSYTLASKRSSYSGQKELERQTLETLREHFGKDFISDSDLEDFGKIMQQFRNEHAGLLYGSDQDARLAMEILQESKEKHVSWREIISQIAKF